MPSEIYAEEMVHEMQSNLAGMGLTNGRRNSDETSVFMPNQITHRRIGVLYVKEYVSRTQ